jgi:hypothetical protein
MKTLSVFVLGGAVLLAGQTGPSYAQMGASGGQSGDQSGSSSTNVGPGQEINKPKSGLDKSAVDMTSGKGGIPEHYDVVPVRRGQLHDEKGGMLDQTVKNPQGETLGTIEKLLKDQKTGKIEYAVLEIAESKYQLPLQWSQFKQQGGNLILKATKADLTPGGTSSMAKDMSPEISHYMEEINKVREAPKAGGSGLGVTNQPASAGSMGEENVGGGGPSGTRALPPQGQAPGHEGSNPSSKR